MVAINGVTTTIVNGTLSFLHSNGRFIQGKSWKIWLFPKAVGKIAQTPILPTRCFKQFLCSSRLASTFGKSLSAVFVASSNSAWRDVESVITAISHFSLWSKTLHCWQKLSKSTNQRVYQDLVYRNALLLKILTSVPAPLSPVPLYFSSLSLLRTAPSLSERLEQAMWATWRLAVGASRSRLKSDRASLLARLYSDWHGYRFSWVGFFGSLFTQPCTMCDGYLC